MRVGCSCELRGIIQTVSLPEGSWLYNLARSLEPHGACLFRLRCGCRLWLVPRFWEKQKVLWRVE